MSGSTARMLQEAGLTNHDSEDIGHLMTLPKSRCAAFCTSPTCSPSGARVEKKVSHDTDDCPECGWALFWKQTGKPEIQDDTE